LLSLTTFFLSAARVKVREESKKKWELKKQRKIELAKKQKEQNNNTKNKKDSTHRNKKSSFNSKTNDHTKIVKTAITQDNIGNIKSTNSSKPKLGLKK
jgi:hypothetical protein